VLLLRQGHNKVVTACILRRHLGTLRIVATPPRRPLASGGLRFLCISKNTAVGGGLPTRRTFFFAAFFLSGEALAALDGATRAFRAAPVPRRALPARADRSTALPWPLASLHVIVVRKVKSSIYNSFRILICRQGLEQTIYRFSFAKFICF